MSELKEFWLEPKPDLSADGLIRLIEEVRPDTILFHDPPPGLKTRVASRQNDADILVTSDIVEAENAKKNKRQVAFELTIHGRKDHEKVVQALGILPDYFLIQCPDWKVIPLENLISEVKGRSKLLVRTKSFDESRIALNTLELGADGIALSSPDLDEILKTRDLVAGEPATIALARARITAIRPIGNGSRVCVDTCEIISPGEGLLTGCSSQGLFLIEGEVHTNPHVNPRPFRVNAGPVSLYVLTGDGKTRYLSELSTGETVLLVDDRGRARTVDVARVKIERRPMILVEASDGEHTVRTIVQNAETVRLVTPDGSTSVSQLKPGDQVLVRLEEGGRHFGTRIAGEMIIEK